MGVTEKEVKVSEKHVWVGVEGQNVFLGLPNYIQKELGTVISIELPEVGDKIEEGEMFAELESVATVHELESPVSGTVLSVNSDLGARPSEPGGPGGDGRRPAPPLRAGAAARRGLRRSTAADWRRANHLAALHRGLHDRIVGAQGKRKGFGNRHRVGLPSGSAGSAPAARGVP